MNADPDISGEATREAEITLKVLTAVERDSGATQRSIAQGVGIALGLANAYLKRCARKGWIKVQQVPANRYAYYLTPRGFAEKGRLTREYLRYSFDFFRNARSQCSEIFGHCAAQGWRRILLAGAGDLSEIATLCAGEHQIRIVGVLEPAGSPGPARNLPVFTELAACGAFDAILITDLTEPQSRYDDLAEHVDPERILTPALLNISRIPPKLVD